MKNWEHRRYNSSVSQQSNMARLLDTVRTGEYHCGQKEFAEGAIMKVVKISSVPKEPFISPLFTGENVTKQALIPESSEYDINNVNFGGGVRLKWHAHDCEQILIVTAGQGVVGGVSGVDERIVSAGASLADSVPGAGWQFFAHGGDAQVWPVGGI